MWRNLKFLQACMWRMCIHMYMSCYFVEKLVLSWFTLFCRNLRTFVWRKIEPKIAYVEKKRHKYQVGLQMTLNPTRGSAAEGRTWGRVRSRWFQMVTIEKILIVTWAQTMKAMLQTSKWSCLNISYWDLDHFKCIHPTFTWNCFIATLLVHITEPMVWSTYNKDI